MVIHPLHFFLAQLHRVQFACSVCDCSPFVTDFFADYHHLALEGAPILMFEALRQLACVTIFHSADNSFAHRRFFGLTDSQLKKSFFSFSAFSSLFTLLPFFCLRSPFHFTQILGDVQTSNFPLQANAENQSFTSM